MKTLIALLVVAVVALEWQAHAQKVSSEDVRRRLDAANTKLDAKPQRTTLDVQDKCAKGAHEQYRILGWDKVENAAFQNHYSETLGKCFMIVVSMDHKSPAFLTSKTLMDAFEGRVFANYIWGAQKDKKYWDVPPIQCEVTLPSGETTQCKSSPEFDELVKAYLE